MKFKHLEDKNMTYGEHFLQTLYICAVCIYCSIIVFIHGIYPDIFTTTVSETLSTMLETVNVKKPNL